MTVAAYPASDGRLLPRRAGQGSGLGSLPWPSGASRLGRARWVHDGLAEEGFIVLGGPIGEGGGENTLLVIDAESEAEVRTRLAQDPWPEELLTIESVRPWSVWLRGAEPSA